MGMARLKAGLTIWGTEKCGVLIHAADLEYLAVGYLAMPFPVSAIQHENVGASHEPMDQCAWLALIDFRLGKHV
jgi:hypothetical protein